MYIYTKVTLKTVRFNFSSINLTSEYLYIFGNNKKNVYSLILITIENRGIIICKYILYVLNLLTGH